VERLKKVKVLAGLIVLTLGLAVPAWADTLIDIQGHWAEKNIKSLVEKGAITGYPGGQFKPNANITRAEVIVVLVKSLGHQGRAESIDTGNLPFADVSSGHWVGKYLAVALERRIVPEGKTFRPSDKATRAEIATMIISSMGKKEQAEALTLRPRFSEELTFKDVPSNHWAASFITLANKEEIIKGYEDKTFKPNKSVTRAEAVTMTVRMLEKMGKAPSSAEEGEYSGLIIDCRGLEITASQSPEILDEEGEEIYGRVAEGKFTDWLRENGVIGYYTSEEAAKERSGPNPLIIKALRVEKRGDVPLFPVISKDDAKIIREANEKERFLESYKVAVVKD